MRKIFVLIAIASVAVIVLSSAVLIKPDIILRLKYTSSITLYTPEDDAIIYGGEVPFSFYVTTDAPSPQVCLLVRKGTGIWEYEFYYTGWINKTVTFENGNYTWWVEIYTPSKINPGSWDLVKTSAKRTFTVTDYTPPPPSPKAPVIKYFGFPEEAKVGETVTFTVSAYDPDGEIKYNIFDFGDGETLLTSASVATHTYSMPGEYKVSVTVVDNDNLKTTESGEITIYEGVSPEPVSPEKSAPYIFIVLLVSSITLVGIAGVFFSKKK